MLCRIVIGLAAALAALCAAAPSPGTEVFRVGLYAGGDRESSCVTAPAGAIFQYSAWVQVPNDLGLRYVTLRMDFPPELDLSRRPVFHDLVTDVVYTDFADGTTEWNVLLTDCPSGWIRIYTHEAVVLEDGFTLLGLVGDRSLARDCDFILNGVEVAGQLAVNDPGCEVVAETASVWGTLKARYR